MSVRRAIDLTGLGLPSEMLAGIVSAEAIADVRPGEVLVFTTESERPDFFTVQELADVVRAAWPNNHAILLAGSIYLQVFPLGRPEP